MLGIAFGIPLSASNLNEFTAPLVGLGHQQPPPLRHNLADTRQMPRRRHHPRELEDLVIRLDLRRQPLERVTPCLDFKAF